MSAGPLAGVKVVEFAELAPAPFACMLHPHARARSAFIEIDGVMQSAPAPRLSRTPASRPTSPPAWGGGGRRALEGWTLPDDVVSKAVAAGALVEPSVPAPVG